MTNTGPYGDLEAQLRGGRMTTAEVLYYIPDHPMLLQSFVWQTIDLAPKFPRIHQFLDFWRRDIEAVIHSVSITAAGFVSPARLSVAQDMGLLH